ncbi:TlpA family protein disulfide reductase [Pseudodesulfovibrio sp.]|nr:TlpA family protein disulfide reductase [Pseudodesulfovibrio sp.]
MERIIRTLAASLLVVVLILPTAVMAGQFFPDSTVEIQLPGGHAEYLGLDDDAASFRFSDVKAEFILVNVFSLYCSPCQRDAADFNEMYDKIAEMGLDGHIKFIGLAAGNTVREMEYWRKKFNVQFPLIPDEDYVLHETLGNVGTPFFALARVDGPDKLTIIYAREGAFEDKDAFFATILAQTGMDVAVNK